MFRRAAIVITIAIAFGTILISCGKPAKTVEYSDSPQVEAIKDPGLYPSAVLVVLPEGKGICTGTIISPRSVLTAAHCTKQKGRYSIRSSSGSYSTFDFVTMGPGELEDPHDLSILIFTSDIAKRSKGQTALVGSSARSGDKIRIVGFGCNDLDSRRGSGVKRSGTNRIQSVGDYIELRSPFMVGSQRAARPILGPKDQAGSCFGDSGGPMYRSDEFENELIGVTHAGGDDGYEIISQYIHLGRSDIQDFIAQVDSQYELGVYDHCNSTDPVPGPICAPKSASLHIMEQVRTVMARLWSWLSGLFL